VVHPHLFTPQQVGHDLLDDRHHLFGVRGAMQLCHGGVELSDPREPDLGVHGTAGQLPVLPFQFSDLPFEGGDIDHRHAHGQAPTNARTFDSRVAPSTGLFT
jgi:hypothetical protein